MLSFDSAEVAKLLTKNELGYIASCYTLSSPIQIWRITSNPYENGIYNSLHVLIVNGDKKLTSEFMNFNNAERELVRKYSNTGVKTINEFIRFNCNIDDYNLHVFGEKLSKIACAR